MLSACGVPVFPHFLKCENCKGTEPSQTTERSIENTFKLSSCSCLSFSSSCFPFGFGQGDSTIGPVRSTCPLKKKHGWETNASYGRNTQIPAMAEIQLARIELATFSVYMVAHGKTWVEVERGRGRGERGGEGRREIH